MIPYELHFEGEEPRERIAHFDALARQMLEQAESVAQFLEQIAAQGIRIRIEGNLGNLGSMILHPGGLNIATLFMHADIGDSAIYQPRDDVHALAERVMADPQQFVPESRRQRTEEVIALAREELALRMQIIEREAELLRQLTVDDVQLPPIVGNLDLWALRRLERPEPAQATFLSIQLLVCEYGHSTYRLLYLGR